MRFAHIFPFTRIVPSTTDRRAARRYGRRGCCFTTIAGCLRNRRRHGGCVIEYLRILGHRRPNASAAAHLSANIRRLVGQQEQRRTRCTLQTLSWAEIETRPRLKAQRRLQAPPSLATLSEGPIPIRSALQETNTLRWAAMAPHLEEKFRFMALSQRFIIEDDTNSAALPSLCDRHQPDSREHGY
jgi:hypothetical protein